MSEITLGRIGNEVWIMFHRQLMQFPVDIELTPCAEYFLQTNDWTYRLGNGCGTSARIQHALLKLVNIYVGVDLSPVCNLHDLEYQLNELMEERHSCIKSYHHKRMADTFLGNNIINYCTWFGVKPHKIKVISITYHIAVMILGNKAYWGNIPEEQRI